MSGGEVLGAVALIPMLMDAFQKVVVFSLECEDFEHQVVRAKGSLSKERSKFFQSIHTLLQDTVDESILAEFENAADRQGAWDARGELAAAVEQTTTLNPKNGVPLRDAFTELCRLFKEWEKEMQKISVESQSDPTRRASWLINYLRLRKQKVKWHTITHLRAEQVLLYIVQQNGVVEELVRNVRQCKRILPSEVVQLSLVDEIGKTQEIYGTLYGAFAASWTLCGCRQHSVSLSLDTKQDARAPMDTSTVISIHPSEPIKSIMTREKYGWHLDVLQGDPGTKQGRGAHAATRLEQVPSPTPFSVLSDPICSALDRRSSTKANGGVNTQGEVLACLQLESKSAFQVTDPGCDGHSSSLQQSLATVLKCQGSETASSSPQELQESFREPGRQLQLAYSLALHLVRLYSTRWLTGHADWVWTAQDIVFFPDHTQQSWRNASPYLFAPSPTRSQTGGGKRELGQVAFVKHPHIFALGAILVEMALGERIDPTLSGQKYFDAVSALVHGQAVEAVMGLRYAELVNRCICFNSDSEKMDFRKNEAQELFVKNILGPLHECLVAKERGTPLVICGASPPKKVC